MSDTMREQDTARFKPGDEVELSFGEHTARAVVTEDRGPLGIGGRRLYRVRLHVQNDPGEPTELELPASQIRLIEQGAA